MEELSERERLILEILADESDRNPGSRQKGIPEEILGARTGAFLNMVSHEIQQLEFRDYVRRIGRIGRGNIIITEEGYRLVKPPQPAILRCLTKYQTPITVLGIIISAIAAIVTLILGIKRVI